MPLTKQSAALAEDVIETLKKMADHVGERELY